MHGFRCCGGFMNKFFLLSCINSIYLNFHYQKKKKKKRKRGHGNVRHILRSKKPTSKSMIPCLYTKHKTQKRKVWQDGFLLRSSTKLSLYAEDDQENCIDHIRFSDTDWQRSCPLFTFPKYLLEKN